MAKKEITLADLSEIRNHFKAESEKIVESESINTLSQSRRKVGRPKSLRSNPDYESTTIHLHRGTKAKARYLLATQAEKKDLQGLLNDLLAQWVIEQDQT